MKKVLIIAVSVYLLFGFIISMYFYTGDLKTFDCANSITMGGFFTNPDPKTCIRRGFTPMSVLSIPILTVFSIPIATVKYYYAKTAQVDNNIEYVVSVNLCGNDILVDGVIFNRVNIIKVMERIASENEKLSLCYDGSIFNNNNSGETIGVAIKEWRWANDGHYISKEEKIKTDEYIIALYPKNDRRQSSDPFNQSTFIYKFDFNNNTVYTQYQFDGSFHEAGMIVVQ